MNFRRLTMCAGLGALAALTGFMLLQFSGRADYAHLVRPGAVKVACGGEPRAVADVSSPADGAFVTCLYFDRAVIPVRLSQGWSDPEPGSGVWSLGDAAALSLPAPASAATAEVTLLMTPYLAPGRPYQRVRIMAGEHELGRWRLTNPGPATLKFVVPASLRSRGGGLDLRFELPDADSPAHLTGAADGRLLAIKLHRATVNS